MESPREQSCWNGFYNVSLCYRQQLAQTYHYTLATNFAPEYASQDDYQMIALMHDEFVSHLVTDDVRRSDNAEELYNRKLSTGLVRSLEKVSDHSGSLRFREMSLLARVIDSFFVTRKPAVGLKNILSTFSSRAYVEENVQELSDPWDQIVRYLFLGEFDEIRKIVR